MEGEPHRIFIFDRESPESRAFFGVDSRGEIDSYPVRRMGCTTWGRPATKVFLRFLFSSEPDNYEGITVDMELYQVRDLHTALGELLVSLPSEPSEDE